MGVSDYDNTLPKDKHGVPGDLKAVRHNLTELAEALRVGKIFDPDEITLCKPAGVDDFTKKLNEAVDSADGLLLFYFAGHGAIPAAGDELWLQMANARVVAGSAAVFQGAQPWSQVLGTLASGRAEQVVVILDCCNAGNAALVWEAFGDKRHISQLMSVQANNAIDAGPGKNPTPFTEQLVRILRRGIGGKGGDVSFHALSDELRAHMTKHHRTRRSEPWEPQSRPGTSGVDVLVATDLPPLPDPPQKPWWRRRPFLAAAAAGAVAGLGWGVYALTIGPGGPAPCVPPLEVRLLTDPDIEPTVHKAVEKYVTSDANQLSNGCRRSGITTYSARAADVVAAFRDNSAAWKDPLSDGVNPQRDIGAQPDIWIPAASADFGRARPLNGQAVVSLDASPGALAVSPIVLAVPEELAKKQTALSTGRKLADLVSAFQQSDSTAEVRRANPEFTDTALLATAGLYGTPASGAAEKTVAHPGLPAPTGHDLLCELPKDRAADKRTAALVPEYLLKTGVSCESLRRTDRRAQYPVDVPLLDPSFVTVTWEHANRDAKARKTAVRDFKDWLAGAEGAAVFADDGFRAPPDSGKGADGKGGGSPVTVKRLKGRLQGTLQDPGRLAGPASAERLNDILAEYRNANGPGRVLFLLDSSGSMGHVWQGPSGAQGILKQSLAGLGAHDEYGIWSVGAFPGARRGHTELLDFGQHRNNAAAEAAITAARSGDVQADPYTALTAALDDMSGRGADDDHPQLIVYITDDEDNDKLTAGDRLTTLIRSAGEQAIPVAMVSLGNGACTPGKPDTRIAEASGGRCLDATGANLVSGLRDEVARTGTGDDG